MKYIILDCNIYDVLIKLNLDYNFFNKYNCKILNTSIVENEINNKKFKKHNPVKQEKVINKYKELSKEKTGFFGFNENINSLGFGDKFSNKQGGIFSEKEDIKYLNTKNIETESLEKHKNDKQIILLAKKYNAIFITNDIKAGKKALEMNIETFSFYNKQELIDKLKRKC